MCLQVLLGTRWISTSRTPSFSPTSFLAILRRAAGRWYRVEVVPEGEPSHLVPLAVPTRFGDRTGRCQSPLGRLDSDEDVRSGSGSTCDALPCPVSWGPCPSGRSIGGRTTACAEGRAPRLSGSRTADCAGTVGRGERAEGEVELAAVDVDPKRRVTSTRSPSRIAISGRLRRPMRV